jgi:hypothetical protein
MIEFGTLKVEAGSWAFARAHLVAGDDQVIVDLVADEGAVVPSAKEPPGEIVAELAALVGDIGKAARGQRDWSAASRPSAWRRLITAVSELVEGGETMQMASWKNYDKLDLCMTGCFAGFASET